MLASLMSELSNKNKNNDNNNDNNNNNDNSNNNDNNNNNGNNNNNNNNGNNNNNNNSSRTTTNRYILHTRYSRVLSCMICSTLSPFTVLLSVCVYMYCPVDRCSHLTVKPSSTQLLIGQ